MHRYYYLASQKVLKIGSYSSVEKVFAVLWISCIFCLHHTKMFMLIKPIFISNTDHPSEKQNAVSK